MRFLRAKFAEFSSMAADDRFSDNHLSGILWSYARPRAPARVERPAEAGSLA
jgi:hypothetical protein